ncbi:gluconate kinase [Curtobacterium pusillum]|uniref:Gluconate kinase n=1 Tax=Curtobacterium pusillum TaxID=69373 RepID=A0AAW3T6T0_9MICO|nr:gluconate kinase [Curtobacterium pusillum]
MHGAADPELPMFLVTGMPGAGKSTVSRKLAAALPRAALVAADDVAGMIMSGGVWPLGEPVAEADRQVDLCYRNIGSLVRNFAGAGFQSVVDCVVPDAAHLDRLLDEFPEGVTELVVLAPGAACCRDRDRGRVASERFAFDGYDELDASMRSGFGGRGHWIDSADLDVDQTLRVILDSTRQAVR